MAIRLWFHRNQRFQLFKARIDRHTFMRLIDFIGWKVTGVRNRVSDWLWERRLGIATRGRKLIKHHDSVRYETFAYSSIFAIMRRMRFAPGDVFVDVGCGKGRPVCCAARLNVRRVIGIDVDEELCRIARGNVERLRGRNTPVEIINIDAASFDYHECTAFFVSNPFGAATVKQLAAAIERSLQSNPRSIRMVYVNPFHEAEFDAIHGFRRIDHWQRRPWSGLKNDVSFWSNTSDGR